MTERNLDRPARVHTRAGKTVPKGMTDPRLKTLALVASLGAGFAIAGQVACSDDPAQCPTGNCTLPGSTVVKFAFNAYPERGFPGDTCLDLGVATVHMQVAKSDDALVTDSADTACGNGQVTFTGLPPGLYNVALTPLDMGGSSLVKAPVTSQVPAASGDGMTSTATVNVPYDAWVMPYTGNFLFSIAWGGVTCANALPSPIVTQRLKLAVNGVVATQTTDSGQRVDGTDPKPCHEFGPGKFEFVVGLPFGPATLDVTGTDAASVTHAASFETFVGVGASNPTLTFDVPTMPDAGVPDGAVDAAPVDAAPVDAAPDAAPDAL